MANTKAQQTRIDWMRDMFAESNVDPSNEKWDAAYWGLIALRLANEGPSLGRTERWQTTCTWAYEMVTEEGSDSRWACLQGSIYMGYAL